MKVNQGPAEFQPVTLTLESPEEVAFYVSVLARSNSIDEQNFRLPTNSLFVTYESLKDVLDVANKLSLVKSSLVTFNRS